MLSANNIPTPADERAWYDVIGKFRDKAQEFTQAYNKLLSVKGEASATRATAKEYNDLIARGKKIKSNVQSITSKIDGAWAWLKSNFGFDGIEEANNMARINGLGVLPIIPIAVVGGSIALLGKWVSDAYIFMEKLKESKRLQMEKGLTPEQAAKVVDRLEKKGAFVNVGLKRLIVPLAILGAIIVAVPMLQKEKRSWR